MNGYDVSTKHATCRTCQNLTDEALAGIEKCRGERYEIRDGSHGVIVSRSNDE